MISRLLPPETRRKRLVVALGLSSVALLVLTVLASTSSHDPHGQQTSSAARAEVMKQATTWTAQAMSYNAATAASDIAAIKGHMTDEMQGRYDQTLPPASDRKRQAKAGVKVVARVARLDGGDVRRQCPRRACAVGILSLTDEKASVLLFVNQYASANSTKNTVVNPTWEVLRLVRRDGSWVIAGMDAP